MPAIHALLPDPEASYHEQRIHARRQARNHIHSHERLGNKLTIQAINPGTGELHDTADSTAVTVTQSPPALARHRTLPPARAWSHFRTRN